METPWNSHIEVLVYPVTRMGWAGHSTACRFGRCRDGHHHDRTSGQTSSTNTSSTNTSSTNTSSTNTSFNSFISSIKHNIFTKHKTQNRQQTNISLSIWVNYRDIYSPESYGLRSFAHAAELSLLAAERQNLRPSHGRSFSQCTLPGGWKKWDPFVQCLSGL